MFSFFLNFIDGIRIPRLRYKYRQMKRFISKLIHKIRLSVKGYFIERQIFKKTWELFLYVLEIGFTGILIHYSLTQFNWLSLGLSSALIMYYIEWFVKLVKRNEDGITRK